MNIAVSYTVMYVLIAAVPCHAMTRRAMPGVYFYLYSKLRETAQSYLQRAGKAANGDIGVGASLIVAFLAGCGNVLLTNPIWVVSTRMQACAPALIQAPAIALCFASCGICSF